MNGSARCASSYPTHRAARRWVMPQEHSTPRTKAQCNDSGTGCDRNSPQRSSALREILGLGSQIAIDLLHVDIAQRTDCLFELQVVDHEIIVGLRQIEPRLKYLLLLVQYVEIGSHAHFETELVGIVRYLGRSESLLERLDLCDAAGDTRKRGLRE